ncbi:hypothetical protein Patl1_08647 [Pistacia atlantica]|uniref:Uncharacterized protein n=1 Tax=Pistacia atlantica TaxID=434234 RepID=A0ACC1AEY4_9ROSI|nr:hypothetical protein Patl1_08647 [Pistacia atlantica]
MFPIQSCPGFETWSNQNSRFVQEPNWVTLTHGEDSVMSSASKVEKKQTEACKSHKEAERRRRQRINAHLSTLRTLLPNTIKTDKASLLAEVVHHVKELRRQAADVARQDGNSCSSSSSGSSEKEAWPFPGESDELSLNFCHNEGRVVKASICCEDRPGLNQDLTQAIGSVGARPVRAEMMTVGGRTKSVVVVEWIDGCGDKEMGLLRRALKDVVENRASSSYGMGQTFEGNKRARIGGLINQNDDDQLLIHRRSKAGREMVWWSIRYKARFVISSMAALRTSTVYGDSFQCSRFSVLTNSFTGFPRTCSGLNTTRFAKVYDNQLGLIPSLKRNPFLKLEASSSVTSVQARIQEGTSYEEQNLAKTYARRDFFEEMKQRFLSFKKHKYLKELEHFRTLAEAQSPKVVTDRQTYSRICPSNILGFQPGETFMIRNVANLIPPIQIGPSETNAALQFAVNTLEVSYAEYIGTSSLATATVEVIQALMTMQEDDSSNLTEKWVVNAKVAKLRTKADAAHLSFEQQCRYCEKESINRSLLNLLTYPWIEDRVKKELLSLHGGYYDLFNCTFEKWTLDYRESSIDEEGGRYTIKDRSFWC